MLVRVLLYVNAYIYIDIIMVFMVFSSMPHDQNFKNAEIIFGFHFAFNLLEVRELWPLSN